MNRRLLATIGALSLVACGGAQPPAPAVALPTPAPSSPAPTTSSAPPVAASPGSDLAAKIDPIFAAYSRADAPGPGCAVGLYRAGEVAFAKGYGLANLEHGIPITASTTFDLASDSKQFTATAIVLLALDGKIDIEDDVRKYVPELPDYGHTIKIRHLLHHTGGLREYDELLELSGFELANVATDDDALSILSRQRAPRFAPGTEWSYSNTGYFLLSIVVKRASGKSLAAFAKERIFEPLGMKSTFYLDEHTRLVPKRATGYAPREGGGYRIEMSNFEQTGDGAVQSTIEDLARWDAAFYDTKFFGAQWIGAMRTPAKLDDGTTATYGYTMGLRLGERNGVRFEEHNGAWAGYRSDIVRFPSEKLTIAVLCNRADASPEALSEEIARVMLPKVAQPMAPNAPSTPTPAPSAPVDATKIVGTYLDRNAFAVRTIAVDGDGLSIQLGLGNNGFKSALDPIDARTFVARGSSTRFIYEAPSGKTAARIVRVPENGKKQILERYEPGSLDAKALAEYAGRYTSDEATHDLELRVQGGALHAATWGRRAEPMAFKPLARDVFLFDDGFGFLFERDARGHVKGMKMVLGGYSGPAWKKK